MSDIWEPIPTTGDEPENTASPSAEPPHPPVEPVAEPVPLVSSEPVPPVTPAQPPLNGWSSDGSYRYVPPRSVQPMESGGSYSPPAGHTSYYAGMPVPPKPPRKRTGWIVAIALVASVAVILGVVWLVYEGAQYIQDMPLGSTSDSSTQDEASRPSQELENAPSLGITAWDNDDGGLATKEIVRRNYASTVLLTSYADNNGFYFGQSSLMEVGASTGIVMTEDGYIITNRHCVINESTGKPYERIDVTVYGDKTYENARVIGADASTDLAVIRIEASNLTPAQFGDSAELEVGDRVVALGNAAGLEWSATEGIVSALARDVYEDTGYAIRCLQVDASINPGNSGGPLLNNQGLVVGINSAKISDTDYEGIGFTIPINEAKEIVDSLIRFGYVKGRVALGISGQTVETGLYRGFMITEVQAGSGLNNTRVELGDLIVGVDGVEITDYGTLRAELAKHKVGDEVELSMLHSDRRTAQVTSYTIRVKLKEQTN